MKLIFRSDMMANLMLWYLMGATEGVREAPVDGAEIRGMLNRWKGRSPQPAASSCLMPRMRNTSDLGLLLRQAVLPRPLSSNRNRRASTAFRPLWDTALESVTNAPAVRAARRRGGNPGDSGNRERGKRRSFGNGGTAKAWLNTPQPGFSIRFAGRSSTACWPLQTTSPRPVRASPLPPKRLRLLTSAYVSDARWPPAPTSPGRFNVREAVNDLYAANEALAEAMESAGIAEQRSFLLASLMHTPHCRRRVRAHGHALLTAEGREYPQKPSDAVCADCPRRSLRTRRCRRPPAWARRRGRGAPDEAADWPRRPRGW